MRAQEYTGKDLLHEKIKNELPALAFAKLLIKILYLDVDKHGNRTSSLIAERTNTSFMPIKRRSSIPFLNTGKLSQQFQYFI